MNEVNGEKDVGRNEDDREGASGADILVVDDEPDVARIMAINLEFEGYRVRVAHDGVEALRAVEERKPDCILLDIMMPGMDGFEVLRRLKKDPGTSDIPVIVVTARDTDMDRLKGFGGGAVEYLAKPFDLGELKGHVSRVLSLRDRDAEERARQERVRRLQLSTLRDITEKLISTLELEEVLETIVERLQDLFELDVCAISLLDAIGRRLRPASVRSRLPLGDREWSRFSLPYDRLREWTDPEGAYGSGIQPLPPSFLAGEVVAGVLAGLRSLFLLPLRARGRFIGVIFLGKVKEMELSPQEAELLAAVGNQAAIAIENARLYDELRYDEQVHRQLLQRVINAQEDERRRLAIELHDGVIQNLVSAVFRMQFGEARLESDPEGARRALRESQEIINQGIAEMRRIISGLRPTMLDDMGLVPALQKYIRRVQEEAPWELKIELKEGDIPQLTMEAETALFRICQEALHNVVKHSRCRRAGVELGVEGDKLVLRVEDDGVGFEFPLSQRKSSRGFGLAGMRERAESLGGTLQVRSAPGEGTLLVASFPLYAVSKEDGNGSQDFEGPGGGRPSPGP
ncbi:response regulator [Candidatus Solincola sp.]|nr:response regulator [Actinomycetota bacterium]MDI7252888.1 response regulator [Actinomycetota bacterium]